MNRSTLTRLLNRFLRMLDYGSHTRPQRDWLIVLSVGGVLLIVCVGWSAWLFHTVSQGEVVPPGMNASITINPSTLESVQSIFDGRSAERAHYQNDYRFVDPSH